MILQLQKKKEVENYQKPGAHREYAGLHGGCSVGQGTGGEVAAGRLDAPLRVLLNWSFLRGSPD